MRQTYKELVGYWLRRYLTEYLPVVRNMSRNTIASYRDALRQLLEYVADKGLPPDALRVEDITPDLIMGFLLYLEQVKNCSIQTRNLRLSAIHSFAGYISTSEPQYLFWYTKLKAIPIKKPGPREQDGKVVAGIMYLEKDEMKTLLSIPDKTTPQGARDYALLMFLYNSGARATEAVNLRIQDIVVGDGAHSALVTISGKGSKTRVCPLWDSTVKLLQPYMKRNPDEPVFLNRYGNPITRYGIYEMVYRYAAKAAEIMPSIGGKNVSPHTIRHSTASHLLEAGVDINTIRSWLGHVSVNTTNIYAEVNIRMKAKALKKCEVFVKGTPKYNPNDKTLIGFLKSL